ncbi:MAG: hypothetical protein AAGF11_56700 [Myxococcota bacterium]
MDDFVLERLPERMNLFIVVEAASDVAAASCDHIRKATMDEYGNRFSYCGVEYVFEPVDRLLDVGDITLAELTVRGDDRDLADLDDISTVYILACGQNEYRGKRCGNSEISRHRIEVEDGDPRTPRLPFDLVMQDHRLRGTEQSNRQFLRSVERIEGFGRFGHRADRIAVDGSKYIPILEAKNIGQVTSDNRLDLEVIAVPR